MAIVTEIERLMGIWELGYSSGCRKLARLFTGYNDAVLGWDLRSNNLVTDYLSAVARAMSQLRPPLILKEVQASLFNNDVKVANPNYSIFGGCNRLVLRSCDELTDEDAVLRVCGVIQREKDVFRTQSGLQSYRVPFGVLLTFNDLNTSTESKFDHFFSERISPFVIARSLEQDC